MMYASTKEDWGFTCISLWVNISEKKKKSTKRGKDENKGTTLPSEMGCQNVTENELQNSVSEDQHPQRSSRELVKPVNYGNENSATESKKAKHQHLSGPQSKRGDKFQW